MSIRSLRPVAFLSLFFVAVALVYAAVTTSDPATFVRVATIAKSLKEPGGVAIAPDGTIYIADTKHNQVRLITAEGQVRALAASGFKEPVGIAYDAQKRVVYVADNGNHIIRRVRVSDGAVTTYCGSGRKGARDGACTAAEFDKPAGLALDAAGNLYVADSGNHRIRRIGADGSVTTYAGGVHSGFGDGAAVQALFKAPEGVTVAQGVVYVADSGNQRVRRIANGVVTTIAGTGREGSLDGRGDLADFKFPTGLVADEDGRLYVADSGNDRIRVIDLSTTPARVATLTGGAKGLADGTLAAARFNRPAALAFAGALIVADAKNDAIRTIDPQVRLAGIDPSRGPAEGGQTATLTGSGFVAGRTLVTFGTQGLTPVYVDSKTLKIVTPAGTPGAVVDVSVKTLTGTSTLEDAYEYIARPAIATVAPRKGKTAGGETLVLTGSGFTAGQTTVTVNGIAVTATVQSPNALSIVTPPSAAGPATIVVTTPAGSVTTTGFTYLAPPSIAGFSPSGGGAGTVVTVNGANFDTDSGATVVMFGPRQATIITATATALTVTVPTGTTTTSIFVTTAGGTVQSTTQFVVAVLTSVTVTPSTASLEVGETKQFQATANFSDGTTRDVTALAAWASSNTSVATVATNGLAEAKALGTTTISASYGGMGGDATLEVKSSDPLPPDPTETAPPIDPTTIPPLEEQVEFLYSGPDPVQTGVAPGTIEKERVAVLRGNVRERNGQPLAGARVTVIGHPELGQTLSRADGVYDLAVNGGGDLTLRFEKDGYLAADRHLLPDWQERENVDDVVLVALDAQATTIDFTQPAVQTARGSAVIDDDGTRQATMLFRPGTSAELIMPDGSRVAAPSLTVRATEYTVGDNGPAAMPAPLPTGSGYTYCVELSADEAITAGAASVAFSKPVVFYVENFVGFPVGGAVPVGWYDRMKQEWVAAPNGRVIAILSVSGDSVTIDIDGDGSADSDANLATLGIDIEEKQRLAALYTAGTSLWRVAVEHFTPWDCNWPYGPPPDAVPPGAPTPEGPYWIPGATTECGSVIDCENQILGEDVSIPGTPLTLHYRGDRVPGRLTDNKVKITLSGEQVPASLKAIEMTIDIAGKRVTRSFSAGPNVTHEFHFDGQDSYGRYVSGMQTGKVTIGYVYDAIYQEPANFERSFGQLSGVPLEGVRGRQEIIAKQEVPFRVAGWSANAQRLGGWTPSVHHTYDATQRILYRGDGGRQSADIAGNVIERIAGNGNHGESGDGGPAKNAMIGSTVGMAVAADGTVYFTEEGNNRIRAIGPDGIIRTIAGTGHADFGGDGGPAVNARINRPQDLVIAKDGSIYFIDRDNQRIRRIANGIITTVAGNGTYGTSPDGTPAMETSFQGIAGLAIGPDNSLYIADEDASVIRRIGTDGLIRTIAGNGNAGHSGDGGPAINATLRFPSSVVLGPDGSIYTMGYFPGYVRRIGTDGIITTVAGNGTNGCGCVVNGAKATETGISWPKIIVDDAGVLYISDWSQQLIFRVGTDGIITTVAGNGREAREEDEVGIPSRVGISDPWALAFGPGGTFYFASWGTPYIRKIGLSMPGINAGEFYVPSPDGAELYFFDAAARHARTVSALTGATLYTFGYNGTLLRTVTDVDGNVTTIERDAAGNATAIAGPFGHRTTLTMDGNGWLQRIASTAGQHDFTYTAGGLMLTYTDPNRMTYQFSYDEEGRLTKDEDPAGGAKILTRTETPDGFTITKSTTLGRGNPLEVHRLKSGTVVRVNTKTGGAQSTTTRAADKTRTVNLSSGMTLTATSRADDRFGAQVEVPDETELRTPSGLTMRIRTTQSTTGGPLSLQSWRRTETTNGRTFESAFDPATSTLTYTSATGRTLTAAVDGAGRVVRRDVPLLQPVEITYEARGFLSAVTHGRRQTTFTYDARGRVETITDPAGKTSRLEYDAADRITKQILPGGRTVVFTHDTNGNVTSVTPPGRPAHTQTFSRAGLLETYTSPRSSATVFTYNADRQPVSIRRADGSSITFDYDAGGRLATIQTPDGAVVYGYEAGNKISSIASPATAMTYSYDGGLLVSASWNGSISGSIDYAYDDDFALIRETAGGVPIDYGRDADGLLTSAGALTLTRHAQNGFLTGTSIEAVVDSWSYDDLGDVRLYSATVGGADVFAEQYIRDDAGRITERVETLYGVTTRFGYGYDDAGRLETVTREGGVISVYGHDANGNRLTHTTAGGTATATHDDEDRLLSYGGRTFTYTPNGELATVTDGASVTRYEYDALGALRKVVLPSGEVVEYVSDGMQRRVGRKVNGSLDRVWLYTDRLRIVAELDAAGAIVSRFVYASRANVPDYMVRDGVTYRILSDHLGSPRLVVDASSGEIAQMLGYDEFGNVLADTNPGFQPFGFAGGLYDRATGLVRYGARDYDPSLGRWITKDPIGFAGGDTNLFGYVFGDPVNAFDPDGLAGKLTIHSDGGEGSSASILDGHSWISYTPEGGTKTTFGTYGNHPNGGPNGLHEGLELNRPEKYGMGDATRTKWLNDEEERRLFSEIDRYRNMGEEGWTSGRTCSTFASDTWYSATGERLPAEDGSYPNPTTLRESIIKQNNGLKHRLLNTKPSPPAKPSGSGGGGGW